MTERNIEDYNNSYFYTPGWEECVASEDLDNQRPLLRSGFFSEVAPLSDQKAARIATTYSYDSYNYWQYDPGTQQYLRFQETADIRNDKPETYQPLMDAATDTQVHAANVVVMQAPHTFANTFDQEDEVYHIDLTGSGDAYVFRDGVMIPARWLRTNRDQPLLLTNAGNGAVLYLRPGMTFYQVIGMRSYISQGDEEWRFYHDMP